MSDHTFPETKLIVLHHRRLFMRDRVSDAETSEAWSCPDRNLRVIPIDAPVQSANTDFFQNGTPYGICIQPSRSRERAFTHCHRRGAAS